MNNIVGAYDYLIQVLMFTLEARRLPYLLNNYRLPDQLDQQIGCPQIIHEHLVD